MIWESSYWKAEVYKIFLRLRKKQSQKRWPSSSLVRFEKDVMVGCFMVRKLFESEKISLEVERGNIPLIRYELKNNEFINIVNKHKFDEKYDWGKSTLTQESPREVCNKIIHSFVFCSNHDSRGIKSLLFNSDRTKSDLFELNLKNLVSLFVNVATDDISNYSACQFPEKDGSFSVRATAKKRGPYCQKLRSYS